MAENTAIEWCDHTFNPWVGCTKVSPGCDHCYAELMMDKRLHAAKWGPGQQRVRTTQAHWALPHKWNRQAAKFLAQHGRRQRVFCASLADVFDNEVPDAWRADLFWLIAQTPQLDWLLLTKRIGNAFEMMARALATRDPAGMVHLPWPNVWLGATVTSQAEADRDVPKLLGVPARVRFLSIEPMLGPVDLAQAGALWSDMNGALIDAQAHRRLCGVNWVICGGESGPQARPMDPAWARGLRDQCAAAGVPFLFKQWGEWLGPLQDGAHDHEPLEINASDEPIRVGKRAAGRLLDGRTHDEFPITHGAY